MRLPWPFRSAQLSVAGSEAAPPGNGASPPRGESGAWRRLPPLGETIGPPPLVAPARPFAEALAASNPPPAALQPLSHGHSLEAPRGIVVGVARPTPGLSGSALPRPVQRSPLAALRRSAEAAELEALPESSPSEPGAAPLLAASAATFAAPVPAPVRRLTVASDGVKPPARALTLASTPADAGPRPGLIGRPAAAGSSRPRPVEPAAAIQRAPDAPIQRAPAAPISSPAPAPDAPRMTLGQARRRGLGAPIGGGPLGAAPPPASVANIAAIAPAPALPSPDASSFAPLAAVSPPALASAPGPDVQLLPLATPPPSAAATARPVHGDSGPGPSPRPATTGAGPASVHREIRPSRPSSSPAQRRSSPLLSASGLGAVGSQRSPLTIPTGVQRSPAGAATASASGAGQVRVHRGAPASEMAGALEARSFTHGGEIYMPDNHGPLTSGPGRALLAHEMTHVAQQRRLGSSLPDEQTSHGRTLEAEAVRAEKSADMPLATPQAGPSSPTPRTTTNTSPALPDLSASPRPSEPRPQRAPAESGGSQGTGGSRSGQGHTEQELEVLAHQLYHRIGRHLRRELLVDRERAGFALDLP